MNQSITQNVFAVLQKRFSSYKTTENMYYVLGAISGNEGVIDDKFYCATCIDPVVDRHAEQLLQNASLGMGENITACYGEKNEPAG